MDLSLKEALGMIVALICTSMVLFSLFNVEYFKGAGNFISSCTQNKVVTIKDPIVNNNEREMSNNETINIVEEPEKDENETESENIKDLETEENLEEN